MKTPKTFPVSPSFGLIAMMAVAVLFAASTLQAAPLRRPVSPTTPMYLMQVDLSVGESAQGAIDAVPDDIKPYVVMMMCPPGTSTTAYTDADNFCSVCRANGMWAMVQVASGVTNTFSDTDTTQFETLFQKYPNLIGFCFAEQNWGFDSTSFATRLQLFADLLALGNQYGGYLYINEMQSISNKAWNTVSKFKTSAAFASATVTYKANFILGSKFTMGGGYYDNESGCLGAYLSGHAGNYAVRYDQYSWSYSGRGQLFGAETLGTHVNNSLAWFTCPEPAMGIPIVDHVMLQGATVVDGPEVPWVGELYKGQLTPVFKNMISDIFRKVLDKTIKIPSYSDVIAKTPIAYVSDQTNNVTGGLYDGLYQIDGDGANNYTWFKKSGRYSSIPELYTSNTRETSHFTTFVLQSQYGTRWPTLQDKLSEFNSYFPSESSGSMFVARRDNRWFAYNPWINQDTNTTASMPLHYNTCSNVSLNFPAHTLAVMVEQNASLQFYLNNYRTDKDPLWQQYPTGMTRSQVQSYVINTFIPTPPDNTSASIRTSTIQVSGCSTQPTYTLTDRGEHPASTVSATFSAGVFTLTVSGNGPADITINCSGSASRPSVPASYTITPPPPATVPDAPTGFAARAVSRSQIDLSWTASNGAASYIVQRSGTSGGPYTTIATGVTATSFSDTALAAATSYFYVVRAVNSFGTGASSAQAGATTFPAAPTGVTASAVSTSQINLSWTAVSGATSYKVKRATVSGGPFATIVSGLTSTSYNNTGLSAGTTYYYVVSAVNGSGESANSTQASATTQGAAVVDAVGIDFVGGGTAMAATENAGVMPKANWNNAAGASGSGLVLVGASGSSIGATVTWSSDHTSVATITDTAGDYRMVRGMINTANTSTTTISVSGLPINAGGYDVYVYCQTSQPSTATRTAAYQISGTGIATTSINATANTPDFTGAYTQANNSAGNYVKYSIGAVSGFTISATPVSASDGILRAPINGIQIIPKPASTTLSINFVGSGTPMAATESAGVAAKTNWNNAAGASGTAQSLVNAAGASTAATVTWLCDHTSLGAITDTAGDYRMIKGMLNTSTTSRTTVTVAGLASNANGYDVYVYCQPSQPSTVTRTAAYQISGTGIATTTVNATSNTPDFTGTYTQAANSVGNYVKYTIGNVAGFTLSATPVSASDGTLRAPINGIQVVAK